MEMAKGNEGVFLNLMMRPEDQESISKKRQNAEFKNLDIMKQGRLLGDIMKLNVLDYIIMHDDRHAHNFLVNLDADETEAMVTGIDNDYILGADNNRQVGNNRSADALTAINNRIYMSYGITPEAAFPMMTPEVKATLNNLDPATLNQLLIPYADRVVRLAAVHRAAELKRYAETVKTCDLTTQEGTEQFVKMAVRSGMSEWVKSMSLNLNNGKLDATTYSLPSTLLCMMWDTYIGEQRFPDAKQLLDMMKHMGLSKTEVENILLENISSSKTADVKVSREELMASEFGKAFENY